MRTVVQLSVVALVFTFSFIVGPGAVAQEGPPPSPDASVGQVLGGELNISITYSRPGVKGREIWGAIVPYDKTWRAGANAPTTVTFSHDVSLNGESLDAGSYTLLITPKKDGEWVIHFIKPGEGEDEESTEALTLEVEAEEVAHQEWLVYGFDELQPPSGPAVANAFMQWEKKKVSFKIALDK